jgi:hypothetical protein
MYENTIYDGLHSILPVLKYRMEDKWLEILAKVCLVKKVVDE